MHVTEILGHGQGRKRNPHTSARRFVHLAKDEGGVLEDIRIAQLHPEVVTFTCALPHPGEHRCATEVTCNAVDHLLDQHCLANARATEQGDFTATHIWCQQVDDL